MAYENYHTEIGTCRRGNGAKIHFAHRSYRLDDNGKQTYVSVGANCNSNGQYAGRDFKEGRDSREVTCTACNPTTPKLTPAERTPKVDSCTAINKKTGKQCTFKGYNRIHWKTGKEYGVLCNTHANAAYR